MSRLRRNPALRPSPWGKYPAHKDFTGQDLSNMDLSGADLTDANLMGANLIGADLTDAILTGANLQDADLAEADLINANLTGANLINAHLIRANLAHANLINADLTNADLTDAELAGVDLSNADLTSANLKDAYLDNANLTGANLTNANLINADLTDAELAGVDLSNANLTDAHLANANLTNANLINADLTNANLTDAELAGVDLSKAKNGPRIELLQDHMRIKTPTSDAFRKWFGKSVVVGDTKNPIVVYHGTQTGGFTEFKPEKRDPHHNAFYFTDTIGVAETYVGRSFPRELPDPAHDPAEKGIYRLYIRLLNPMVVDAAGKHWRELSDWRAPHLSKTYEIAKWAQDHGFDGVIFKNIIDDGGKGPFRIPVPATVYAVFDPKAIKSATANNGNYDPNDPDIRHNPGTRASPGSRLRRFRTQR
jgi:uncharacterized protein YjbI with pentapeptide repeats